MAFISVSGEDGCPVDELAAVIARDISGEVLSAAALDHMIEAEFGTARVPDKAWRYVARSIVAREGLKKHVVLCAPNGEIAIRELPFSLRIHVFSIRGGKPRDFDLMLNAATLGCTEMAAAIGSAIHASGVVAKGYLTPEDEAQVQFHVRLQLARYGIAPVLEPPSQRKQFNHPSEEIFAHLLDFYRIRWEYEPRSFPLQWDKQGNVLEAFTPDFYLPEFDVYIELTTMKQANVTKKNRKVRLLRAIYPHVNIQVFYQKDFQDLVSKYRVPGRMAE